MKKLLAAMALFGFLSVAQAETPGDSEFECDDFPACVLQVKAWDALAANEYKVAYKFAAACVKLDEEVAREQQASLSAKPSDDDWLKYGALNSAGTCTFVKAEALMKLGKTEKAKAAYETVVNDYPYAKAWDPRGWFWTVADAAQEAIDKM